MNFIRYHCILKVYEVYTYMKVLCAIIAVVLDFENDNVRLFYFYFLFHFLVLVYIELSNVAIVKVSLA